MTTSMLERPAVDRARTGPLRPYLQVRHEAWRHEVQGALAPVLDVHASVWTRSAVVRYLGAAFLPRLTREQALVNELAPLAAAVRPSSHWAYGELLWLFSHRLGELACLYQCGGAFSTMARKLVAAFDGWCTAMESFLGDIEWSAVPPRAREALEPLASDAPAGVHGMN